jgi:hypothetical protein
MLLDVLLGHLQMTGLDRGRRNRFPVNPPGAIQFFATAEHADLMVERVQTDAAIQIFFESHVLDHLEVRRVVLSLMK